MAAKTTKKKIARKKSSRSVAKKKPRASKKRKKIASKTKARKKTTRKKSTRKKTTRGKTTRKKKRVKKKSSRKTTRKRTSKKKTAKKSRYPKLKESQQRYCVEPHVSPRPIDCGANPNRERLIRIAEKKWVNGTRLHYHFFTNAGWRGTPSELNVVRNAFDLWKDLGMGLEFIEVDNPDEAEIRIGFQRGDGTWSYVGRDVLEQSQSSRTMNFGWNIRNDLDTALHEIGHSLGFPHEHQNPNAGIEWDEETVYRRLAGPPNFWSRRTTFWNIIRKLPRSEVEGSEWDKDSIMHYPFEAGMILEPDEFRNRPLIPAPGLSERDAEWAQLFYPEIEDDNQRELVPFESVTASLAPGEQIDFVIRPTATRWYQFATFGRSDSVIVLFEDIDGEPRYRAGDDDSGDDLNAWMEERLFAGRTYRLRVRLYWAHRSGDFAVMMW